MSKTALFTDAVGAVAAGADDNSVIVYNWVDPVVIGAEFSNDQDRLVVYHLKTDGATYEPYSPDGRNLLLSSDQCRFILDEPGTYALGGTVTAKATGYAIATNSDIDSLTTMVRDAATSNDFVVGSVGYLHTDGTVVLADATTEAASNDMLLMATAIIDGDDSGVFARFGDVTVAAHGFDIGTALYITTTGDGSLSTTAPGETASQRIVGYAIDDDTISFHPDNYWYPIAS